MKIWILTMRSLLIVARIADGRWKEYLFMRVCHMTGRQIGDFCCQLLECMIQ